MEGLMMLNIFFILLPDICTCFEGHSITLFLVWGFVIFLLSHKSHYVFYRVHTSGGLWVQCLVHSSSPTNICLLDGMNVSSWNPWLCMYRIVILRISSIFFFSSTDFEFKGQFVLPAFSYWWGLGLHRLSLAQQPAVCTGSFHSLSFTLAQSASWDRLNRQPWVLPESWDEEARARERAAGEEGQRKLTIMWFRCLKQG